MPLTHLLWTAGNPDWQHLDPEKDGVFGISDDRAYDELLRDKTGTSVIVAVLDGGADTGHEDLKSILWINNKKKQAMVSMTMATVTLMAVRRQKAHCSPPNPNSERRNEGSTY
ncbi:hypothetical protein SAMN05216436_11148 [bacterium A37T11]|nr:hypothetical protein SAMN05216436_11148 [bacterium A37T11]